MKKIILPCLLVCTAVLIVGFTTVNSNDNHRIEVIGFSEIEVIPNKITIEVEIRERDSKGKESIEEIEKEMLKSLEKIGIDPANNVAIIDLSSNFRKYVFKKSDIYTSKSYEIKVSNATLVRNVFIELEKLGISNIEIVKFEHTDKLQFERDMRIKAIQDAKEKATYLAQAINQNIGNALFISEVANPSISNNRTLYDNNRTVHYKGFVNDLDDISEIEFEKIKIESRISAWFVLE